jgi:hypothetical protein
MATSHHQESRVEGPSRYRRDPANRFQPNISLAASIDVMLRACKTQHKFDKSLGAKTDHVQKIPTLPFETAPAT